MGKIRQARRRLGLSQEELAEASGVSAATIVQVELGNRRPQGRTLRKLAGALGVEVADLFEDERHAPEVFEQALERVLEPVRTDVRRDQQAVNRLHASQGVSQSRIGDPPEAEVARKFLDEFAPEERPLAFGEVALGYARLEHNLAQVRDLLRERDHKLARLEEENTQLKEERERVEAEKARTA